MDRKLDIGLGNADVALYARITVDVLVFIQGYILWRHLDVAGDSLQTGHYARNHFVGFYISIENDVSSPEGGHACFCLQS